MAQKVQVLMVDDLDGTEYTEDKGETITFGLDGVTYEIDLKAGHADALRVALAKYKTHGRKVVPSRPGKRGRGRTQANRQSTAAVREWAREQGKQISERGRIPADILAEYEAAH